MAAGDMARGSPQPLPASGFSELCAVSISAAWACCPAPAVEGVLATPLSPCFVPAPSTCCLLSQPKELLQAGLGRDVACPALDGEGLVTAGDLRVLQGRTDAVPAVLPRGQD